MRFKLLAAASLVALSSIASANAADIVMRHHEIPNVIVKPVNFSFTGFYLGAQGAYRWGKQKIATIPSSEKEKVKEYSQDLKGGSSGIFAGFNSNLDNGALFGIETDMLWNNLKGNHSYAKDDSKPDEKTTLAISEKWLGATRLRFGYAQDHVLPYIAGGIAYTKLDVSSSKSDPNPKPHNFGADSSDDKNNNNKTILGWTVGAGVDYAATDNVLVRLEYRYTDFGKKEYAVEKDKYNIKYRTHDVRVGVAYKF